MHNESFGPPRELLEVYGRERENGLATEGLRSWLHKRAQDHYLAASDGERKHCRAAMGAPAYDGESTPRFWPR